VTEPASNRIDTSAVAPQTVEPVRTTFYLEEIVADQLTEMADAALALVQGIRRHLTKPGECSGPGKVEITDGALRLERAINPDRLKFNDPQRIAIMPRDWPATVWSDLRDIRHHFDNVMTVCDWKDLCDGPNPLRRWEPIPLNGFVRWPQCEVDNADLQKIESAAQRLKSLTTSSASPTPITDGGNPRSRLTKDEANIKARDFLREHPDATARELAAGVGCSTGLVSQLPAWQAVKEQRDKGRQPKKAATVALTPKMEQVVGVEDEALTKLISEQEADAEPSPLFDDAADVREGAPRRAKIYRKP
jgi:hypothetical protein